MFSGNGGSCVVQAMAYMAATALWWPSSAQGGRPVAISITVQPTLLRAGAQRGVGRRRGGGRGGRGERGETG